MTRKTQKTKPCEFASFDSVQERLLFVHAGDYNHVSHSVVGLVFQVGETEKFHQTRVLESLELFLSQPAGPMSYEQRRMETRDVNNPNLTRS